MVQTVTILGSTGSIGENTLDLIRRDAEGAWQVVALTAHTNVAYLAQQAIEFKAKFVAIADESKAGELRQRLSGHAIDIGAGPEGLVEAARQNADFTMSAIVGAAGLEPTLAAVDRGARIGLANKECLVCAGDLFMQRVAASGAILLPVAREYSGQSGRNEAETRALG